MNNNKRINNKIKATNKNIIILGLSVAVLSVGTISGIVISDLNTTNSELKEENKALTNHNKKLLKLKEYYSATNADLNENLIYKDSELDKIKKNFNKLKDQNSNLSKSNNDLINKKIDGIKALEKEKIKVKSYKDKSDSVKTGLTPVSKTVFQATAYAIDCPGCSGITASGKKPTLRNTVAADTSIYPLGTKLYLDFPNAKSHSGIYTVEDRGGAIKGNILDVYMGTYDASIKFGRQTALVSVIK